MLAPYKFPDLTPLGDVKPRFDEVSQCLMDAAQVIRERGHHKGSAHNERTGAVCIIGGMAETCAGYRISLQAQGFFKSHIGILGIADWNDAPERTADEVIAALEGAAYARALSLRSESPVGGKVGL